MQVARSMEDISSHDHDDRLLYRQRFTADMQVRAYSAWDNVGTALTQGQMIVSVAAKVEGLHVDNQFFQYCSTTARCPCIHASYIS